MVELIDDQPNAVSCNPATEIRPDCLHQEGLELSYKQKTSASGCAANTLDTHKQSAKANEEKPLTGEFGPRVLNTPTTYCNPLNLDYAFVPKKDYSLNNAHRSSADPACVRTNGKFFLFSTNQEGYWHSDNLAKWQFVPHKFKPNANDDQVCAPGAWSSKLGTLLLPSFTDAVQMPLYVSQDPENKKWSEATPSFPFAAWDPALFVDDDDRLYCYWGSSNTFPIKGVELDPNRSFRTKGPVQDLLQLDPQNHGWERFGQDNQSPMRPYIEGPSMNKINNQYYLQYAAPGTEWNVYGDGVYVSKSPLGPFVYQEHNPFSWKPTGFITGAGHGSTFDDKAGNLWHVASMVISKKDRFERRLGLFPTNVDKDGVLHANTSFGDYPQQIPTGRRQSESDFTGWMLLSHHKSAIASESKFDTSLAFDENIKTYWSAHDGKPGQFLQVDLGAIKTVNAIQVNFADENADVYGKKLGLRHRYQILESSDGKDFSVLVDKSSNNKDVPHDYVQLAEPVRTRYLKLLNIEMPTGCFAIGDFRIFGKADGDLPENVSGFNVKRDASDRRESSLSWSPVSGAYAYEINFGVAPDKLYSSLLVHDATTYDLHSLNTNSAYYFSIRAVSETGTSQSSPVIHAP